MSQHSFVRAAAETRFEKIQRHAEEGAQARTELEAAVSDNTARLKALRLAKEQADRDAAALAAPPTPAAKKPRAKRASAKA